MNAPRGWTWHNAVALALFLASCATAALTLASGGDLRPLPTARASDASPPTRAARRATRAAPTPDEMERLVIRAVERDPFRAERARAPGRYRTVVEIAATPPLLPPTASTAPMPTPIEPRRVVLRGIAADASGRAVVAVEIDGEQKLMRVGESFAGHRLESAGRGEARFRGPDGTRTVRIGS